MRHSVIALAAGALFSAAAFAQGDRESDRRVRHHWRHHEIQPAASAPRVGDSDRYAPKVGAPESYTRPAGAPNPYATRGGDPNPYATRGGDPVPQLPTARPGTHRR